MLSAGCDLPSQAPRTCSAESARQTAPPLSRTPPLWRSTRLWDEGWGPRVRDGGVHPGRTGLLSPRGPKSRTGGRAGCWGEAGRRSRGREGQAGSTAGGITIESEDVQHHAASAPSGRPLELSGGVGTCGLRGQLCLLQGYQQLVLAQRCHAAGGVVGHKSVGTAQGCGGGVAADPPPASTQAPTPGTPPARPLT